MEKIWNFVKNFVIIAYILLIIFVTICLISYNDYQVTVLGETTLLPVIDEDLEPDFTAGDLILIRRNNLSTVREGDKIFFYRKRFGEVSVNYATVIAAERVNDTEVTYTVEGDYKFSSSNFIGKVSTTTVLPKIGTAFSILQSKWGFLFLGVFPSLVAFMFTLHSVVTEFIGEDEKDTKKKKKKKKKKSTDKDKKVEKDKEVVETEKNVQTEDVKSEIKEDKKEEVKAEEVKEEVKKEEKVEEIKEEKKEVAAEIKEETKIEVEQEVKVEEKQEEHKNEVKEETKPESSVEDKRKAAIEAKMKGMTEEEKRALIKAKLDSMTDEEKKALIEARKKKLEAEKNKKGEN